MKIKRAGYAFALALILCGSVAWAEAPEIQNLEVSQRAGSYEVEINYDLVCADCDSIPVTAWCSLDGGESWTILCRSVTGDIGPYVTPGTGSRRAARPETPAP